MFWSNGYCLFVYNNAATIRHHYYYIFLFSATHLFRVLLTSDYLDIKGDQWKRRSLTEEDAFRELVHWCCCCCCAPRSWLCRSLHTTFNISASWHPPCCCCVCAPLCTQCIAECSSSIFTPSFPPPPPFPSTAAAMAAILHLLMPPEQNAAFLTHKLHAEGKWQNWMRHNLEGNNFSINIFSQKCTYHRNLMKGIFSKGCARILRVTRSDVFKNSEGNRINVSYYCFNSRPRSCKFLMSVFVILRWLPPWEQGELLSLTTVWIIDAEVGKTCRSQSLYRID